MLLDSTATSSLFEQGGVLIDGAGCVRDRDHAVAYLMGQQSYLAASRSVTTIGNVAVVVGDQVINISRRDPDAGWLLVAAIVRR